MCKQIIFTMHRALKWTCLTLIRSYRFLIAPLLGPRCRFYPSCSHYALEVIGSHPLHKGLYLTMLRILRCHPFNRGGFDPAPKNQTR